jgi:hypothetical protein
MLIQLRVSLPDEDELEVLLAIVMFVRIFILHYFRLVAILSVLMLVKTTVALLRVCDSAVCGVLSSLSKAKTYLWRNAITVTATSSVVAFLYIGGLFPIAAVAASSLFATRLLACRLFVGYRLPKATMRMCQLLVFFGACPALAYAVNSADVVPAAATAVSGLAVPSAAGLLVNPTEHTAPGMNGDGSCGRDEPRRSG